MIDKKYDKLVPVNIGLVQGLSSAFFGIIAVRLGASPLLVGIISSSPYLGNIFAPVWSFSVKFFSIRKLLSIAIFLSSLFLFLLMLTKKPNFYMLFAVIYYIFFGGWEVLYPSFIELLYSDIAINIIARFDEFRSITYTLSVFLSGFIMELFNFKITFLIAIILLIISGIVILKRNFEINHKDEIEKINLLIILREDEGIKKLVLIFMIAGTGMLIMLPAIPILEVNVLKLTNANIGFLFSINSLAYILGIEAWNRFVKNLSRLYMTFNIGIISIIFMGLIYAFFPNYLNLIIANIFCGIGGSSISFFWQTFSITYPDYRTEDLSSLHLFTCGIRGIYSPLIGSLIISFIGLKFNFLISIIFVLIGFLIFLFKGKDIFQI